LCDIVDQGYRSGSNLTGLSFMEAESETTGQDGPAEPPPFRLIAAGTFTGGKSFWLVPAGDTARTPQATGQDHPESAAPKSDAQSSPADRPS